eukprot:scaffold356405_cov16-Prasinocladus_malaysianus.AAC.1
MLIVVNSRALLVLCGHRDGPDVAAEGREALLEALPVADVRQHLRMRDTQQNLSQKRAATTAFTRGFPVQLDRLLCQTNLPKPHMYK